MNVTLYLQCRVTKFARLTLLWELQSASGEELSALMPSVLDRVFVGNL